MAITVPALEGGWLISLLPLGSMEVRGDCPPSDSPSSRSSDILYEQVYWAFLPTSPIFALCGAYGSIIMSRHKPASRLRYAIWVPIIFTCFGALMAFISATIVGQAIFHFRVEARRCCARSRSKYSYPDWRIRRLCTSSSVQCSIPSNEYLGALAVGGSTK